jgi:flagellin-like hook-associated protein FlgL
MTYTLANTASGEVSLTDADGNVQVLTGLGASFSGTLNFDKMGVKISGTALDLDGTSNLDGGVVVTTAAADKQLQIGANASDELGISIDAVSASGLSIDTIAVTDNNTAGAAITAVDAAIVEVSTQRANLGAWQNRLEHTINNLSTASEKLNCIRISNQRRRYGSRNDELYKNKHSYSSCYSNACSSKSTTTNSTTIITIIFHNPKSVEKSTDFLCLKNANLPI